MKNIPFLFILCLVGLSVLCNSCKKVNQSSIESLFSQGSWELATVVVTVSVGTNRESEDTLNTMCDKKQIFTFNSASHTCSYTNFQCKDQPVASGTWSLSQDQLYLKSDIVCQDTSKLGTGTLMPFENAQIQTLGQYAMVLVTGDIQNYSATQRRTVRRYGFVRQKVATR
ncbi:DUF5004 domain-containing protein [Mucilaginibacter calamicampi]|uniref:DUF5004 domain-containing protein n=1 Tax=Mucilaginibacter calamicampi TaxID=1302352 RepID=A0ABW2YQW9_9SPHI